MLVLSQLLVVVGAVRLDSDSVSAESRTDLCNHWLFVQYQGVHGMADDTYGSFRYLAGEWKEENNVVLAIKQHANGCKKTYLASCEQGGFIQKVECPDKETVLNTKCLGGWSCVSSSRKTDLESEETATVYDPVNGTVHMSSGKVMFSTIDPDSGVTLEPMKNNGWKTELGCYCCQHSYDGLHNPFSVSGRRVAWTRTGGGRTECMLAFRMIGNGLDHDNIVDSSALGVFAMIPEFIGTFVDTITGTLGRHLACKASCALRKVAFEPNKYPYTKISTSVDKY
ncbi:hypothetical protein AK812_SmicGene34351 [Symbiodinium microadriaticum]|uniref:Uncharacterized protein n=1 Tax=Symbiodinium microadriaticum TaxID=2951 RepID=A0A1Q9CP96_SYMMI|nr:hypothetical protein AK812_SmicGene34351 [Symbiodinium microadriaticum]CAE6957928.1 unnamed protein product [Symbiodinium sp. KB8]CAE7893293.1 unnamed protein product [Symbiodinium microadriaticum]